MTKRNQTFNTLKTLSLIGALSTVCLIPSCNKTTYPHGEELNKRATLINGENARCQYVKNGEKVQLITQLFLDTDGNRATTEYVALDVRSLELSGKEALIDYEKAIRSLKTGDNRTLREWQNVAPNIYYAKYFFKGR